MSEIGKTETSIIPDRLTGKREDAELSQNELAKIMKVSVSKIIEWESGTTLLSIEQLLRVAHRLNVNPAYLTGETDNPERSNQFIRVYEMGNNRHWISHPGGKAMSNNGFDIIHYQDNEEDIYQNWIDNLRDTQGRIAILRTVDRLKKGNFGKHHFCRDGVWELIIDTGPGYRVYYSMMGNTLVLLLCAGSKRTQDRDIDCAVTYLRKFREAYKK